MPTPRRGALISGVGSAKYRASGGSAEARIFCQRFEAEVVAINGVYLAADDMDPAWRGRAVQIALRDGACVIEAL